MFYIRLLLTLVLLYMAVRVVVFALMGRYPNRALWLYLTPLAFIVALFWLLPWEGAWGERNAEQMIRSRGISHLTGLPDEIAQLPLSERPRWSYWTKAMEAETGIRVVPVGSIGRFKETEYQRAFRQTVEREIKRRFGDDVFQRVARRARELQAQSSIGAAGGEAPYSPCAAAASGRTKSTMR